MKFRCEGKERKELEATADGGAQGLRLQTATMGLQPRIASVSCRKFRFVCFETGLHLVQAGPELAIHARVTVNFSPSGLYVPET